METKHPITPPPELMEQWRDRWIDDAAEDNAQDLGIRPSFMVHIATQAARWGADQELEACCKCLIAHYWKAASEQLRITRRPKPPSLKEQALTQLDSLHADMKVHGLSINIKTIRRALEQLDD